jgi:hypothetical protein
MSNPKYTAVQVAQREAFLDAVGVYGNATTPFRLTENARFQVDDYVLDTIARAAFETNPELLTCPKCYNVGNVVKKGYSGDPPRYQWTCGPKNSQIGCGGSAKGIYSCLLVNSLYERMTALNLERLEGFITVLFWRNKTDKVVIHLIKEAELAGQPAVPLHVHAQPLHVQRVPAPRPVQLAEPGPVDDSGYASPPGNVDDDFAVEFNNLTDIDIDLDASFTLVAEGSKKRARTRPPAELQVTYKDYTGMTAVQHSINDFIRVADALTVMQPQIAQIQAVMPRIAAVGNAVMDIKAQVTTLDARLARIESKPVATTYAFGSLGDLVGAAFTPGNLVLLGFGPFFSLRKMKTVGQLKQMFLNAMPGMPIGAIANIATIGTTLELLVDAAWVQDVCKYVTTFAPHLVEYMLDLTDFSTKKRIAWTVGPRRNAPDRVKEFFARLVQEAGLNITEVGSENDQ